MSNAVPLSFRVTDGGKPTPGRGETGMFTQRCTEKEQRYTEKEQRYTEEKREIDLTWKRWTHS
jgi:hypothetical protein